MEEDISHRIRHEPAKHRGVHPKLSHNLTDLRQVAPKPVAPTLPKQQIHQPHQPRAAHTVQHQTPVQPRLEPWEMHKPHHQTKDKKRDINPSKFAKIAGTLAVVLIAAVVLLAVTHHHSKKSVAVKSVETAAPYEQPAFPIYFPVNLPSGSGVAVDKKLIAYYKDVFSFILEQDGKKAYFIDENSAGSSSLNDLKVQIKSPQNFISTLGPGISGAFGQGAITAVQTKDNTIIKVSCGSPGCAVISKKIIDSMQPVSNPASLK